MANLGFIVIILAVVFGIIGLFSKENRTSPKYIFNLIGYIVLLVMVVAILAIAGFLGLNVN